MKVLVTGGAGYIGSHAARVLRRRGHEVIILDNLSTGHRRLVGGFEFIEANIADTTKLAPVLKRVDAIIHFAAHAYVGESVVSPRKYFRNNVEDGLALLNSAVDAGVRFFVFSSSCAVYGVPPKIPITEDSPPRPINPYGISKLFFENALESYDKAYGLRSLRLRYFNAAGADESGKIGELHNPETHLIPLALTAAAGLGPELEVFGTGYPTLDGTCIRDYTHVSDLADAHALALDYLIAGRESTTLNLGTGIGYSVKQVISVVQAVTGNSVPYRPASRRAGDPPELIADPSKAEKMLYWKASRTLYDMVDTAWRWMQQKPTAEEEVFE